MPRPTLVDLLNEDKFQPQAYDRFTRRPVHFIDGPIDIGGMIPATGAYLPRPKKIFVSNQSLFGSDRTASDKNSTLKHEVLHSIFDQTRQVQPRRMALRANTDVGTAEHAIINLLMGNIDSAVPPEEAFSKMQQTPTPSRNELEALSMIRRLFNFRGFDGIRED